MAVSVIYLDEHGQQVAERVSDITYKSANINYRLSHNDYWIIPSSEYSLLEYNLLFECGSDKGDFIKIGEGDWFITFYVKFHEFKKSSWSNYPARNTIYISPEGSGLTQDEYYSLCYQLAEEKIRALARLASDCAGGCIPISFSDFRECFSKAFFVDAFTVERPDFSHFTEAVNEVVTNFDKKCSGSEVYNALIYFQLPAGISEIDFVKALEPIKKIVTNLKIGVGFNSGSDSLSITAAIYYRHPEHGANR